MGVAAYNRGSLSISQGLDRDYENSRSAKRDFNSRIVRAELRIEALELFCRNAQGAFVDLQDKDTAKGFALSNARDFWLRKRGTKKFVALHGDCVASHAEWVNSDRTATFHHLQACHAKARAWKAVLQILNRHFEWKFDVPRYI